MDDLARILDRVFNERCGFRVKVDVEYLDLDDPESRERNEAEFQQKITFLSENLRKERARKAEVPDGEQTENREEKDPVLKGGGNSGQEKARGRRRAGFPERRGAEGGRSFTFRKSDNPDVLYGRDFEDEPITLDQVVEEMGEVTVRGQIRNMEEREIRGERTIITLTVTDFTDTIHVKMFTKNEALLCEDQRNDDTGPF